ncbi:MAG: twin-arginine translocase subunit TatC [archaeon]|nr:MAG: twin-arginine translocase subunit TatC [archaeon]
MSILSHLEELRRRLKAVAVAYFVSIAFWLFFPAQALDPGSFFSGLYKPMISVVLDDAAALAGGKVSIISGSLTAPLEIYFLASAVMALITSSPVIGYEVFRFVEPALKPEERSLLGKFVIAFVGLMVGGAAIGYFVLTPAVIRFMVYFANIFGIQSIVTASDYYGFVFITTGATGLAFAAPSVFVLLVRFGILSTGMFTKNRLLVYLGLYVVIVAVTPEPIVGHLGIFLPLVILLEIAVIFAKRVERKRYAENSTDGTGGPERRCSFCGSKLGSLSPFCPSCGKSSL